ncbi:hypothetical protein [Scytonema sp. NUACC21]
MLSTNPAPISLLPDFTIPNTLTGRIQHCGTTPTGVAIPLAAIMPVT